MSKSYNHLGLDERRKIYFWREQKLSVGEIAKLLGRHRSTIFRELQRNTYWDEDPFNTGYFHMNAHEFYRRRRQKNQKIQTMNGLKEFIIEKLKFAWSPEQIAGYLKHISGNDLYACHETIYRFIYSQEGKSLGLYKWTFRGRKNRTKRFKRRPRDQRGIPEDLFIKNRPDHIDKRQEIGHWEADLMIFEREHGKANITTLTERKTRYTFLIKNGTKQAQEVMGSIRRKMASIPRQYRKTVTFDRGSEFLAWPLLSKYIGVTTYYCEPRSPWQKGTVENTNGRIRRFLPRETNLNDLPPHQLEKICNQINATPRKCLGYKTPSEVFLYTT
jgi:IS30 family transposase